MWKSKKVLLGSGICFLIIIGYGIFYSDQIQSGGVDSGASFPRSLKTSPKDVLSEDEMEAIYWKRRERMKRVCRNNPGIPRRRNESLQYIYVNEEHKAMYCIVPKVSCTSWLRFMLILSGKFNSTFGFKLKSREVHSDKHAALMPRLSTFSDKEVEYRLKNYYKFFFVRDPYERILSAYKNKFLLWYNYSFRLSFGRKIIKRFRKNPTKKALDEGHDVKFGEFVQYLVDPRTKKEKPFNVHWQEYHNLCSPCEIDYDFVGKYETFNTDADYVLKKLNVSDDVTFPVKQSSTSSEMDDFYKPIPKKTMQKLQQVYQYDLDLFGYSPFKPS